MTIKSNEIVTITGVRGSGKSYLLKKIISKNNCFLVYDVMHEHNIEGATIIKDLSVLGFHLGKGHKKLIYRPQEISTEEFDWICNAVYRLGNRTLFVEEANRVIQNMKISKGASQLVDLGRHRNVGLVCITRRIALLDKLPVSQSEHLIVFKTILPNDIKYLKEFIGEIAETVPSLKDYNFLYHHNNETVKHLPI